MGRLLWLSLWFPMGLLAQNALDKVIYLDSLQYETTVENAHFSRVVRNYHTQQNEYLFSDYYASGQLKMAGKSSSRNQLIQNGEFTYYYENGQKKEVMHFKEARQVGDYASWYDSGEQQAIGSVIESTDANLNGLLKIDRYWDERCEPLVIDGQGQYTENDGENSVSSGPLQNGIKHGTWIGSNNKYHITFTEEYNSGKLTFGTSTDAAGKEYHYKQLHSHATPRKGMPDPNRHAFNAMRSLRGLKGVSGQLVLSYVIDPDGNIVDIKVIKSLHPKVDAWFIDALSKSTKMNPEIHRGYPHRQARIFPLTLTFYD